MPKAKKPAFYAVARGRLPGVYMSWEDCEAQVTNFPGARHKKFLNAADAEDWVQTNNLSLSQGSVHPPTEPRSSSSTIHHEPPRQSPSKFRPAPMIPTSQAPTRALRSLDKGKNPLLPNTEDPFDESGPIIVYCDGACKGNGKTGSIAGIGVWWGRNDPRNLAERCPGPQTNNRAELIAIARVLETVPRNNRPLIIKTDSQYSINCLTVWLQKWRYANFKTSKGEPVKNAALIRYIEALLAERAHARQKVTFEYVRGHSGEVGNEGADMLANVGSTLPEEPERDWEALEDEIRSRLLAPPPRQPNGWALPAPAPIVSPHRPTARAQAQVRTPIAQSSRDAQIAAALATDDDDDENIGGAGPPVVCAQCVRCTCGAHDMRTFIDVGVNTSPRAPWNSPPARTSAVPLPQPTQPHPLPTRSTHPPQRSQPPPPQSASVQQKDANGLSKEELEAYANCLLDDEELELETLQELVQS